MQDRKSYIRVYSLVPCTLYYSSTQLRFVREKESLCAQTSARECDLTLSRVHRESKDVRPLLVALLFASRVSESYFVQPGESGLAF